MDQKETLRDRYRGCLIGGAVGDALGAAVEFNSLAEIKSRFGPQGIQQFAKAYGGLGRITDDTQMTMFTAEGLLRATVRGYSRGIGLVVPVVASAYHRWLLTQKSSNPHLVDSANRDGLLFSLPELHSWRAPGNTCLSALRQMTRYGELADNNSKGCGGVMRAAPVGLFSLGESEFELGLGCDVAAITHGHPTGYLTGGVLAEVVRLLVRGEPLDESLAVVRERLRRERDHEETETALAKAIHLANQGTPPEEAILELGEGWVAEEALAISVYCALVATDFSHAIRLAVNHDGDRDSTGAITGNLVGAQVGLSAIEGHWLETLELRDTLQMLADDLLECPRWPVGDADLSPEAQAQEAALIARYPGH